MKLDAKQKLGARERDARRFREIELDLRGSIAGKFAIMPRRDFMDVGRFFSLLASLLASVLSSSVDRAAAGGDRLEARMYESVRERTRHPRLYGVNKQ